jgi:hypothetical protein
MRKIIMGATIALLGAGCTTPGAVDVDFSAPSVTVEPSSSPFSRVIAGQVQSIVPDGWDTRPAGVLGDARGGFVASPEPDAWIRMDGSTEGMSATWVDATEVGVPSDFYYLAARGRLLPRLTHSDSCDAERRLVYLNHHPTFDLERRARGGDYVAQGEGTCNVHGTPTRWAYFVAAPGFGPVRKMGIPASGLYVVVAVMPDSQRAEATLRRLIEHTSFGGSSVPEFTATADRFGLN